MVVECTGFLLVVVFGFCFTRMGLLLATAGDLVVLVWREVCSVVVGLEV